MLRWIFNGWHKGKLSFLGESFPCDPFKEPPVGKFLWGVAPNPTKGVTPLEPDLPAAQ